MLWRVLTLMSLLAPMLMSGCGSGATTSSSGSTGGASNSGDQPKPRAPSPNAVAFPQDKATATIKGTVSLNGQAPEMKPIDMRGAAMCAALHKTPVRREEIVANDGKLANAVVYVTSVGGKAIENVWTFDAPTTPATLDQKGCMYIPHVLAIQVDQTINVHSSDDFAHNAHYFGANRESNDSYQTVGSMTSKTLTEPELGGKFVCNIHNWMSAYVNVFPHPFFAVTADGGTYTLPKLPPGEYELAVWHESANDSGKLVPAETINVKAGDNETLQQDFTLKVK